MITSPMPLFFFILDILALIVIVVFLPESSIIKLSVICPILSIILLTSYLFRFDLSIGLGISHTRDTILFVISSLLISSEKNITFLFCLIVLNDRFNAKSVLPIPGLAAITIMFEFIQPRNM